MSDFEDVFGSGSCASEIINGFSGSHYDCDPNDLPGVYWKEHRAFKMAMSPDKKRLLGYKDIDNRDFKVFTNALKKACAEFGVSGSYTTHNEKLSIYLDKHAYLTIRKVINERKVANERKVINERKELAKAKLSYDERAKEAYEYQKWVKERLILIHFSNEEYELIAYHEYKLGLRSSPEIKDIPF